MKQLFRLTSSLMVLGLGLLAFNGCGSSSPVRAGSISVIDPSSSGAVQLKSLAVGKTAKLTMAPIGDAANAGVDWTVICGGSPLNGSITGGACGTLNPAHTSDAGTTTYTAPALIPYLTNVTITAAVTSSPAANSTLILPITALPIAVSLTIPPPASVVAGQTVGVQAVALNDTALQGVMWSVTCNAASCGTFDHVMVTNTEVMYTAPAIAPPGGTVTLTATSIADSSKSISATVMVVQNAIAVMVTPATTYVATSGASNAVRLTATVLNDSLNGGVNWTLSCGATACGSITKKTASGAPATYIAPNAVPAGGTVTITATSATDPTQSGSTVATIVTTAPIVVTITSPLAATLIENQTATLNASVANDPASRGVDWTATCGSAGACGTFNLSPAHTASRGAIIYTAPAAIPTGGTVTLTATSSSTSPSNPASAMTTIVAAAATIALTQMPPATVTSTMKVPVSATVTNDATPAGVTWSVQCPAADLANDPGACGYVTPSQTASGATANYVAPPTPPSGPVTVVASSRAFPNVMASSSPITITAFTAVSINFIPFSPAQVTTGSTINLVAAVTNDPTNAGVDWQVCASGCGFFTVRAAIAEIPATPTTPLIPAVPAVTATSVPGWPNGLPIPYTAPDTLPQGGDVALAATAHANPGLTVASNVAVTTAVTGPSISGSVQAGTQPVVGSQVSLYAAGVTGYASLASQLGVAGGVSSATTGTDGSFTLPAGYVCPQGAQVYLVATGGTVGSNAASPNLSMMTALGPCANLGGAPVVINEVTTVASVWPLAQFSTNQPLTGLSGYLNLGTSSSNTVGLARAFATVNNLVDITTGQARYTVPTGNANVPYVEINTIADALNACTASAGGQLGDGSPCGNLFAATAPLVSATIYNSLAPTDTVQAAFNAAQNPAVDAPAYQISPSGLFSLLASTSPFQPTLPKAPHDLGISLHYTGGGGLAATSGANFLAIDGADNIWITATASNQVIELNGTGAAISPAGGYTAGGVKAPGPIAIDSMNNVWVANSDSLSELTSIGSPAQGSPFYGVTNGLNMAIDGRNNIWITNPGGVTEYNNLGQELSPVGGYVNQGVSGISQITIDPSNDIWLGYASGTNFNLAELTASSGQLIVTATLSASATASGGALQTPLVSDGSGDIWGTPAEKLCKLPPYRGTLTTDYVATCLNSITTGDGGISTIYGPYGIALDGAGTLWIANAGTAAIDLPILPNLTKISPSTTNIYGGLAAPSLAAGPLQVALDGAGNAWVLLSDSSLTEYVGVAVPVVTPLAAGIANKKVGKTP